ncbi:MAG: hypothetical protein AAF797_11290 [Planctomycetota bacterium]
MPEALIVSPKLPGGGCAVGRRGYYWLEELRDAGYRTRLVTGIGTDQSLDEVLPLEPLTKGGGGGIRVVGLGPCGLRGHGEGWGPSGPEGAERVEAIDAVRRWVDGVDVVVGLEASGVALLRAACGDGAMGALRVADLGGLRSSGYRRRALRGGHVTGWAESLLSGFGGWVAGGFGAAGRMGESWWEAEVSAWRWAELTLVSSNEALGELAAGLGEEQPGGRVWVVGDGETLGREPVAGELKRLEPRVAYCGDLAVPHHARACVWLAKSVWPRVRSAVPGARLAVVGARVPGQIGRLHGKHGVEVIESGGGELGRALENGVWASSVAGVCPQRMVSGCSGPVFAGLGRGRVVVGLSCLSGLGLAGGGGGAGGIGGGGGIPTEVGTPSLDGGLVTVGNSGSGVALSAAVVGLLRDRDSAERGGRRAYQLVRRSGGWVGQWRRVGAMLRRVAEHRGTRVRSDVGRGLGAGGTLQAGRSAELMELGA